jgi:hypothetical protein
MPSSLNGTGVTFNDGTQQNTESNYIQRVYTGPATWSKPANLKAVKVTVIGGGGGGGGTVSPTTPGRRQGGGGGGGGAAIRRLAAPEIPGPVSVTIGAGGASRTAGGTSSFGAFASATGGAAGSSQPSTSTATGGAGGTGSSGDLNIQGGNGGDCAVDSVPISAYSSANIVIQRTAIGGATMLGFGGPAPAVAGRIYGGGGGGGAFNVNGAAGAAGVVVVEEFY